MHDFFDWVVVINLMSRPDRLADFQRMIDASNWPFRRPEVIEGIVGTKAVPPRNWKHRPGNWGCYQTHRRIAETALIRDHKRILVMEDDAILCDDFTGKVTRFLDIVPEWDCLMLGGQHVGASIPTTIPGVTKCLHCVRTHCYAMQGEFIQGIYQHWSGTMEGTTDWELAKLAKLNRAYAPTPFLVGQRAGQSDIKDEVRPTLWWNREPT